MAPVESAAPKTEPQKEKTTGVAKTDMLALMNYLKGLAGSLPNKERDNFMQSDARISMEYVIDTLEGRKGLFREIEARRPVEPQAMAAGVAEKPAEAAPAPAAAAAGATAGTVATAGAPTAGKMAVAMVKAALAKVDGGAPTAGGGATEFVAKVPVSGKTGKPDLAGTLAYLSKLAAALPDPSLGTAISRKVNTVISEIRKSGAKGGNTNG
jgi:hypothetical protein